jgi:UDP:flavonoid glycosyltransferase YjiC (YdhE family)
VAAVFGLSDHKVLNNSSYQKNSALIGESFKASGGYKRAADKIFEFKKRYNIS